MKESKDFIRFYKDKVCFSPEYSLYEAEDFPYFVQDWKHFLYHFRNLQATEDLLEMFYFMDYFFVDSYSLKNPTFPPI